MNEYIQQIIVVLQDLLDEHRQLIEYGKAKTKAITENNIEGISYISNKEKKCVQSLLDLEKRRILLVGKYTVQQKITSQRSFKMEKLIQAVYHADEKRQLQLKWSELSAAINELQQINEFNQQLVRMSLDHLQYTQDLLFGPPEDEMTYHRAVQGMAQNRQSRFNTRT